MSKLYHVQLTTEQQTALEQLIHRGSEPAQVQTRARILLLAASANEDKFIAQVLTTSVPTVQRTRQRFVNEGLSAALYAKARAGRPPKFTGELEAQLVVLACTNPPEGFARWSLRLLADQVVKLELVDSISNVTVAKILKKTNYSPGKPATGASPKPTPAM